MKYLKTILIAFLFGVSVFSVFRYISSIKEKYALLDSLEKGKTQIAALENEKQNLLQTLEKEKKINLEINRRNALLKGNLKSGIKRIERLFKDFNQADEQLNSQISTLKAENVVLRQDNDKLKLDLARISQQNDELDARLTSIPELKKAIRELKKQRRPAPLKEAMKNKETDTISEGNKGFIIKNGVIWPAVKVKIEVKPALKSEQ